jgi:hypothetical protein
MHRLTMKFLNMNNVNVGVANARMAANKYFNKQKLTQAV